MKGARRVIRFAGDSVNGMQLQSLLPGHAAWIVG
jgi:hypothetical protein